jgi:hypothetical protein
MSYEVKFRKEEDKEDYWREAEALDIIIDGEVVETYLDGGEPEDNSFYRDWNWVPTELERAYKKGLEDARQEIFNETSIED